MTCRRAVVDIEMYRVVHTWTINTTWLLEPTTQKLIINFMKVIYQYLFVMIRSVSDRAEYKCYLHIDLFPHCNLVLLNLMPFRRIKVQKQFYCHHGVFCEVRMYCTWNFFTLKHFNTNKTFEVCNCFLLIYLFWNAVTDTSAWLQQVPLKW